MINVEYEKILLDDEYENGCCWSVGPPSVRADEILSGVIVRAALASVWFTRRSRKLSSCWEESIIGPAAPALVVTVVVAVAAVGRTLGSSWNLPQVQLLPIFRWINATHGRPCLLFAPPWLMKGIKFAVWPSFEARDQLHGYHFIINPTDASPSKHREGGPLIGSAC